MSPALNRSSALQHFKCGDMVKICNRIMFDFYLGLRVLPTVYVTKEHYVYISNNASQTHLNNLVTFRIWDCWRKPVSYDLADSCGLDQILYSDKQFVTFNRTEPHRVRLSLIGIVLESPGLPPGSPSFVTSKLEKPVVVPWQLMLATHHLFGFSVCSCINEQMFFCYQLLSVDLRVVL